LRGTGAPTLPRPLRERVGRGRSFAPDQPGRRSGQWSAWAIVPLLRALTCRAMDAGQRDAGTRRHGDAGNLVLRVSASLPLRVTFRGEPPERRRAMPPADPRPLRDVRAAVAARKLPLSSLARWLAAHVPIVP